jgi:hypothetical protein
MIDSACQVRFTSMDEATDEDIHHDRYFESAVHFCAAWDQRSFDPDFEILPLEAFLPTLNEVFARKPSVGGFRVHDDFAD